MTAVNHIGFVIAAYGAAVAVVAGLIAWVMIDYYVQRRRLIDLDKKGIVRRSAAARPGPALEEAKEKA
jgi:heme exporter protein D